jgi:hypothetical protein
LVIPLCSHDFHDYPEPAVLLLLLCCTMTHVGHQLTIIVSIWQWWCGVYVGVLYMTAQLETPREGYDEHSSKSSLSCETKVYRTSRRKNQTSEG